MSRAVILLALVPILAIFNYSIFEKETVRREGELILLQLAPVDPRSLMQGDYMRLNYEVAIDAWQWLEKDKQARNGANWSAPESDHLVLAMDEKKIGKFVRFHQLGTPLADNERLLSFKWSEAGPAGEIKIHPDAFFFQEGHGDIYEAAKFGMFRMSPNGAHVLVNLADADGHPITQSN